MIDIGTAAIWVACGVVVGFAGGAWVVTLATIRTLERILKRLEPFA